MSEHETMDRSANDRVPMQIWNAAAGMSALRAVSEGVDSGVACRLGDASCASAHASRVSRRVQSTSVQQSVLNLQRQYGNHYVGQVLRTATGESEGGTEAVERSIEGARGGGQGMDHLTRGKMETAFGADFTGVRIHTDARADGLSQSLAARAFTTGRDVFFRQDEYNPGASSGRDVAIL